VNKLAVIYWSQDGDRFIATCFCGKEIIVTAREDLVQAVYDHMTLDLVQAVYDHMTLDHEISAFKLLENPYN
jgi:hypothetical protein